MPPSLTIITPTFQMAQFLPQAIDSVVEQGVQGLEYLVLDGGSNDGTVDILPRYEDRLRWRSGPDGGAAAALRQGFSEARGEILGWLSADDLLLPGALESVQRVFREHPEAVVVFGGAWWVGEDGQKLKPYPVSADAARLLDRECLICQPACFFRADAYRAAGGIDASLNSAFDYDLWIRMARIGPFLHVREDWACSRMYASNKSLGQRRTMFGEAMLVLERHFGYVPFHWVYSAAVHRRDGRDQFFEQLRPSLSAYLLSLPAGLWRNPHHPVRYFKDWTAQATWSGLRRRIRENWKRG